MTDENNAKNTCKNVELGIISLKNVTNKDDLFEVDIAIKELIKVRNTLDFIHKEQATSINWSRVLKAMQ